MVLKLIGLTHKNEVYQTYEIYKHCMFMPAEEKFSIKADQFLDDNSVKILACCDQDMMEHFPEKGEILL